jgi:ABC-type transporter Mla MlaB component
MALSITKQADIFELEGELTPSNIASLKPYFELLMEQSHFVKLSINKLKELDYSGIQFVSSLYQKAVETNKAFFIVNLTNKEWVKKFKKENIFTY